MTTVDETKCKENENENTVSEDRNGKSILPKNGETTTQHNNRQSIEEKIRQLKFLGHIVREESLEYAALTGMTEGARVRGRQQEKKLRMVLK